MPRVRKSDSLTPQEINALWEKAVLPYRFDEVSLPDGIVNLYKILTSSGLKKPEEMYCFIMYDIENDRVRRLIAKYLERKGCFRVQKSIFFAHLHRNLHREITESLRKIQQTYDNQDSIMVLPVGEDMLNKLTCIGKDFEWEIMTGSKHTLFF